MRNRSECSSACSTESDTDEEIQLKKLHGRMCGVGKQSTNDIITRWVLMIQRNPIWFELCPLRDKESDVYSIDFTIKGKLFKVFFFAAFYFECFFNS